jgi:molecular chaperone HtpG
MKLIKSRIPTLPFSADAVDVARSAGALDGPGCVEIQIDQASRSVFIRDNGAGLGQAEFVNQLTAIGGSSKRGTTARGFRGVGRLGASHFAKN